MEQFRRRFLSVQSITAGALIMVTSGVIWLAVVTVPGIQAHQAEDRAVQRATAQSVRIQNETWCTYIKAIIERPGAPKTAYDEVNRKTYANLECVPITGPLKK